MDKKCLDSAVCSKSWRPFSNPKLACLKLEKVCHKKRPCWTPLFLYELHKANHTHDVGYTLETAQTSVSVRSKTHKKKNNFFHKTIQEAQSISLISPIACGLGRTALFFFFVGTHGVAGEEGLKKIPQISQRYD